MTCRRSRRISAPMDATKATKPTKKTMRHKPVDRGYDDPKRLALEAEQAQTCRHLASAAGITPRAMLSICFSWGARRAANELAQREGVA